MLRDSLTLWSFVNFEAVVSPSLALLFQVWLSRSFALGALMVLHGHGLQVVMLVHTLQVWLYKARPLKVHISPRPSVSLGGCHQVNSTVWLSHREHNMLFQSICFIFHLKRKTFIKIAININ